MGGGKCLRINFLWLLHIPYRTKKLLKKLIFFRIFAGCAQKKNKMINNNQKLQQMALHKQNNYTSPEVTVVEFKMEKGFENSFTVGKPAPDPETPADQGTEDFQTTTWPA